MNKACIQQAVGLLLVALILFCALAPSVTLPILIQSVQADPGDCPYHYVEQMPSLPAGGGVAAIGKELARTVKVPRVQPSLPWRQTVVYFVVGARGNIYRERILKSSGAQAYDEALLAAVRALPRLEPGRQNGVAVSVGLTVPVPIDLR
jgi:protein TonB